MVIMAVLAGMAWQGIDGMSRVREASETRLQHSLRLNTVLAQWEQDLASLQDTGVVPALAFDGASLRLTRQADEGVQLVVWALRPRSGLGEAAAADPRGGNVWQRWASPPAATQAALQEHWLASQQFQGNEAGQLLLLDGVAQWQLYFYRGNAWSNAQSSGNAARGTTFVPTRVELPSGVRLVIEMAPGQQRSGSLTRDIALAPRAW